MKRKEDSYERLSSKQGAGIPFSKAYDIHKRILKGKKSVLLGEIEALSRKRGYCYAKTAYLCQKLGICKKTLMNYYRDLESLKMIKRQKKGRRTFIFLGEAFFLGEEQSYTDRWENLTPIDKLTNQDPQELSTTFFKEEKTKEKRLTRQGTLLSFDDQKEDATHTLSVFQVVASQFHYDISPEDLEQEVKKFLLYHEKGSRFSLWDNVCSWIQKDNKGIFFQMRMRARQRAHWAMQEEARREKRQEEEEKRLREEKEAQENEPFVRKFFQLLHEQEKQGSPVKSLAALWEEAVSLQNALQKEETLPPNET